ncbi:MAG: efflux transporter outer membrane subunit [Rhodanobacter sp.]
MRLHSLVAVTALTLALSACASSGGLHPQGTLVDAGALHARQSLAGHEDTAAAWPAADWWTRLGDAQLSALIGEALHDNPALAVIDARARAAQSQAGVANAARLPNVNTGASASAARIPDTVLPAGGHFAASKYVYVRFSWGLDLWGGKRDAWEAAVGAARAAEVEAHAARNELSVNVARAYAQLGYAFAKADLGTAELVRANAARALTQQRFAAGIDNRIQLKQSDAEIASAQQNMALARQAVLATRSALSVLLGKGPDRGLQIQRPHLLPQAALSVPANLPVGLLAHRPDLVAARWRVEAASKDIRASKKDFLPNISLGALAGVVTRGSGNLFSLPARFYQFGPSLSLPIFDGGRLRAQLAGKDAAYDWAAAQYNQTLVAAVNQVADDFSALQSLDEQIAAQQRAYDAAKAAWDLAMQRYKAGIGSYLEALSVRQQLLEVERGSAALAAQRADMSLQLIQALGGGYQPHADNAPPTTSTHS